VSTLLGYGGVVPAAVYGNAANDKQPTVISAPATWAYQPDTLRDARDKARSIILAQVISAQQGNDLVVPAAGEPEGVDRLPTQRVTLKVLQAFKGGTTVNEQLTLFQTGGTVTNTKGERAQLVLDGDPLYQSGERYLLMLVGGPNGMVRTIAPEGRYRYTNDGSLTPLVAGAVADEVKGKRLSNLASVLKSSG
jgi:hypothetical protein